MMTSGVRISQEGLDRAAKAAGEAMDKMLNKDLGDREFLASIWSRNPWRKKHRNLTLAMRVERLDPKLAAEMKATAERLGD